MTTFTIETPRRNPESWNPLSNNTQRDAHEAVSIECLFSPTECEEAGVVPINIEEDVINIGAMNPNYAKVKHLITNIKRKSSMDVTVRQITAQEWEKMFKNNVKEEQIRSINNQSTTVPEYDLSSSNHNTQTTNKQELTASPRNIDKERNDLHQGERTSYIENIKNHFSGATEEKDKKGNIKYSQQEKILLMKRDIDKDDKALRQLADTNLDEYSEREIRELDEVEICDSNDPVISGVASILHKCITLKASDIHAEPLEDRLRIRYRVDGVLNEVFTLPKSHANTVTSRLKIMSNLDIAEKRLPQDGRICCSLNHNQRDFRVSTLPGKYGEKVVLRALESNNSILDLDKLITSGKELQMIREMGQMPYGIVIVVGPTGSGKSTTLYSILNELNEPSVNISTVEDPVEYTLDGIHQVQVIREKGLDFSKTLRSLMRQDPDIILVGETRDKETAQTAMEAALTGHIVFTTLHANDTATAITRLIEMGIPPYLVGASLSGVVAQRLVRKVCSACSSIRRVEKGRDDLAITYGIKEVKEAKQIVGNVKDQTKINLCHKCGGRGYKGRIGLFEVMKINDNLREIIMKHSTADIIREHTFKSGGRSLLSYGMELVEKQLTTLQEVERVCLLDQQN